jgi:hypothetical protein
MILRHIDNSFYRLTPAQARFLSVDGQLPRDGYEKRADMAKLATVELRRHDGGPCQAKATHAEHGWIKRTRVSGQTVWAVHLYFSPSTFQTKYS